MGGLNGDGQRIPARIFADHVKLSFVQFNGPWVDVGLVERRSFSANLQVEGVQADGLRVFYDFPHRFGRIVFPAGHPDGARLQRFHDSRRLLLCWFTLTEENKAEDDDDKQDK